MEQLAKYGLLTARILIAVVIPVNGFGIIDQSLPAHELAQRGMPAAYSVEVPLFVCGVITAICALARLHLSRKELIND